jgi:serpin B
LALILALGATGCAPRGVYYADNPGKTGDLTGGVTAGAVTVAQPTAAHYEKMADFTVKLLQKCVGDGNAAVSPLSVLMALGMTANGAKGETLAEMEAVFGMTLPELNALLYSLSTEDGSDGEAKLRLANSIWFKDTERLSVNESFLQKNADYYGADVLKAAFDAQTLEDINAWISDKTDGMIENILDEIPADAVMYLINALCFDAEWERIYTEYDIYDGVFTTEDGKEQPAELMRSEEALYLDDGAATGFIKPYAGDRYAFAALLPNEGTSIADYVAGLTGEGLYETLKNPQQTTVYTALPKFESEFDVLLNDVLSELGMPTAFNSGLADFTDMATSADGNIYISRVIHKTFISVDERGTKAGAATVVEMVAESAPSDPKIVILDRPFVYMLLDLETGLPFFIGTTEQIIDKG